MHTVDHWAAYKLSDLPPRDAWLIDDPAKDRFVTPTDDRGLIIVDKLIEQVKATIVPSYTWPGGTEIHHFYWFDGWYPNRPDLDAADNPAVFRNIAYHKGIMPKIFEAWLHAVTLPVEVPSLEVRRNRVLSWWTARNLFYAAQESLTWEQRVRARREDVDRNPDRVEAFHGEDVYGEAYMRGLLDDNFHRFETHLRQNEDIPPEFRIVTAEEPEAVITQLGKYASKKSFNFTSLIKAA